MTNNIAITGSSGYLGTALVRRLEENVKDSRVIGLDIKEPEYGSKDFFTYYNLDIRDSRLFDALKENNIDTLVHLAWIVRPTRKEEKAWEYDMDVGGTKNVLNVCEELRIENIIVASSSKHYSDDTKPPWKETDKLDDKIDPMGYSYARNKVIMEGLCEEYKEKTKARMVVFRPTHLWGPTVNNHLSNRFKDLFLVKIKCYDPLRGFIHVDDASEYFYQAIINGSLDGIFNISAGSIPHSEAVEMAAKAFGKRVLNVEENLARKIVSIGHKLHVLPYGPAYMYTIMRDIILDTEKVQSKIGKPRYSARETFEQFVKAKM